MPTEQRYHTIEMEPPTFRERLLLDMITMLLMFEPRDEAITILLTLFAEYVTDVCSSEEQIDAIVEQIRISLKDGFHQRSIQGMTRQ